MKEMRRSSGILLHVSSLPGSSGIGTLGREAYDFARFLKASGQSYWQVLPLGPVLPQFGFSPYAAPSAFAGNEWFISLDELARKDLLSREDLPAAPSGDFVDFAAVQRRRGGLLQEAARRFFQKGGADERPFQEFCAASGHWLDDFALFIALAEEYGTFHWPGWEDGLARRQPRSLAAAVRAHAERIRAIRFAQFCFFEQWQRIRAFCGNQGIRIIGDIPIYVSLDSADTWAHGEIFALAPETAEPLAVAGVPPDYFSADGQRWGNPLYNWFAGDGHSLNEATFRWWRGRIRHALTLVDWLRIDHFRGFAAYWEIPAACPTAREGRWVKGPGESLFRRLEQDLGDLPLLAEDLGVITPEVVALRDAFAFPGMKVLQFAFDGKPDNPYLPHNYASDRCVVYTGTHDNNTTNGWFYGPENDEHSRQYVLEYLASCRSEEFHWQLIGLAFRSTSRLAVIPMQDLLGFGADFRMNTPGRAEGNWRWMLRPDLLAPETGRRLLHLTRLCNRLGGQNDLS